MAVSLPPARNDRTLRLRKISKELASARPALDNVRARLDTWDDDEPTKPGVVPPTPPAAPPVAPMAPLPQPVTVVPTTQTGQATNAATTLLTLLPPGARVFGLALLLVAALAAFYLWRLTTF